ncbi:MAG TPA: peptidase S8/S53 subtilisin kexin sedolisin [Terriglobia bacterium]|nr:peptidase S8/S53 subtilisin kexin sedolisin [Terriglobia bacterium]
MSKTKLLLFAGLSCAVATWGAAASLAAPQQDEHTPPPAFDAQDETLPDLAPQPEIYKPKGSVITPESSVAHPEDAGIRAHTNVQIFVPAGRQVSSPNPDFTFAETPASMACVYKVGPNYAGCNPATGGTNHATGGWGAIALVDAYDNPTAANDLKFFASYYGLPAPNFTKVYANTSFGTLNGMTASCSGKPAGDTGWGLEEDLDIQWAHAMAPAAKIFLIEACTSSYNDLLYAEQVAGIKVSGAGGGDISNSWSSSEFSTEVGTTDDVFYRYYWQNISYFASADDSGWGAAYPSSSPWVISAGGTTVNRDANGNFQNESCWSGSGGGVSAFELWQNPPSIVNGMGPWSNFQYPFAGQTARQTPDLAFNSDPASGVYMYDTYGYGGWLVVGGTSVASPSLAGIINGSNNRLGQAPYTGGEYTTEENNLLYDQLFSKTAYVANFYDVTTGSNGVGHNAGALYDQCTGVGSPRGKLGK